MKVLFLDMVAAKPYTCITLQSYAMGGSEATVLRVARALAKEPGYEVYLFQGCDPHRTELAIDGILHCNDMSQFGGPDVIVHLRTAFFIEGFKEMYPKARHIVWLHDIVTEPEPEMQLADEVVCVSKWHMEQAKAKRFIYNPVVTDTVINRTGKVPGRLGFFSSPHKGLNQTLKLFFDLFSGGRESDAAPLSLVIANPGYMPDSTTATSGVINLGQLPHHRVLEEMSKCEVLFYPQTVFPETFGLVLAEANAMGTPVLCHDFGAASEVLDGKPNRVIDCTRPEEIEYALFAILVDRPAVKANPKFAIEAVVADWKKLLEET